MHKGFPHILPYLLFPVFFNIAISHLVLIYIALVINDIEYLFMLCVFRKMSVQIFCPYFNEWILLLSSMS